MYQITSHQNEVINGIYSVIYIYNDILFYAWNMNLQIQFLES